jgi:hypothetical protein
VTGSSWPVRLGQFVVASSSWPGRARRSGAAWWSQTGSNRRPHACKACALPAELWPRTRRRMLVALACGSRVKQGLRAAVAQRRLVGLGRLELPTSRLSSARSNQLSYKPLTIRPSTIEPSAHLTVGPSTIGPSTVLEIRSHQRIGACSRAPARAGCRAQARAPARVRPRRKRNVDGEIPPVELTGSCDRWPLMFPKRSDRPA